MFLDLKNPIWQCCCLSPALGACGRAPVITERSRGRSAGPSPGSRALPGDFVGVWSRRTRGSFLFPDLTAVLCK